MLQLRSYQQQAIHAVYDFLRNRDGNPAVVMPTGCHAAGHPILMYDGIVKAVEDVQVGDLLMGPDSKPRKVLTLCRGEDELYKILPAKGKPFVVNGDHILSLVCTNEGKREFVSYRRGGEIDNISVRSYLKKSKYWRHLRKLRQVSVDFCSGMNLPIPPYILGLLIGDGSFTDGGVGLTTTDEVIAETWIEYAHNIGCGVTVKLSKHQCPTYRLSKETGKNNILADALDALGLQGKNSGNKFIPHPYLVASRIDRLLLLAGLLDSDGYANKSGIDYITKSQELATDIVFLLRSLGYATHCTTKYCSCQTEAGGWFYRISAWGDFECVPCCLKRRKPKSRKQKKNVLRSGFKIEPAGYGNYYGFMLDGDHLYLDGNFIVHHNSGKTPVIASICLDAVNMWDGRVLVLSHVKELLEQTAGTLSQMAPELDIGIYSAGLKRREKRYPVTVAGIQSVYKRACEFDPFDLVIVDEAHMIPPSGEGMYQTFLKEAEVINPHVRLIGLTATPYRMTTGMICTPDHLLNEICFEVGVRELIAQGYLCPLRSKASKHKIDTSGLHIRGGEFIASEVEALMDDEPMVLAACREIIEQTKDRNKVLIFAAGVEHGLHIQHILEARHRQECGFICGETLPFDRAELLQRFRDGDLKYLCNVNVLTMGFDAPNIDCVALVRPTNSPGLYYQMIGRGFRIHESKENCLVLDYGGNIMRHGPVDAIRVSARGNSFEGQAPVKECPNCHEVIHAGYSQCPQCEFVFESDRQIAHEKEASTEDVLSSRTEVNEYDVQGVAYHYHIKRGAKPTDHPTLRVEYQLGLGHRQSEWLCFEHLGYARAKAADWWRQRSNEPVPNTVQQAIDLAEAGALAQTTKITVRSVSGEAFDRITEYKLGPKPPLLDGSEERDNGNLPDYQYQYDSEIPF